MPFIVDGDEGLLKRIRKQEGAIILESANPAYQPRVFTGESMNRVRVVGNVVEIRRQLKNRGTVMEYIVTILFSYELTFLVARW